MTPNMKLCSVVVLFALLSNTIKPVQSQDIFTFFLRNLLGGQYRWPWIPFAIPEREVNVYSTQPFREDESILTIPRPGHGGRPGPASIGGIRGGGGYHRRRNHRKNLLPQCQVSNSVISLSRKTLVFKLYIFNRFLSSI